MPPTRTAPAGRSTSAFKPQRPSAKTAKATVSSKTAASKPAANLKGRSKLAAKGKQIARRKSSPSPDESEDAMDSASAEEQEEEDEASTDSASASPEPSRRKPQAKAQAKSTAKSRPSTASRAQPSPPAPTSAPGRAAAAAPPAIPDRLLSVLLNQHFTHQETSIGKEARKVVGVYVETFVREAVARAEMERRGARGVDGEEEVLGAGVGRGGDLEVSWILCVCAEELWCWVEGSWTAVEGLVKS